MSLKTKLKDVYKNYFRLVKENSKFYFFIFTLMIALSVANDLFMPMDRPLSTSISDLIRNLLLFIFLILVCYLFYDLKGINFPVIAKMLGITLCVLGASYIVFLILFSMLDLPMLASLAIKAFIYIIGTMFIFKIIVLERDNSFNPFYFYFKESDFFIHITVLLCLQHLILIPIIAGLRKILDASIYTRLQTFGLILNMFFLPVVIIYLEKKKDSFSKVTD